MPLQPREPFTPCFESEGAVNHNKIRGLPPELGSYLLAIRSDRRPVEDLSPALAGAFSKPRRPPAVAVETQANELPLTLILSARR